jgi:hypothetical protein
MLFKGVAEEGGEFVSRVLQRKAASSYFLFLQEQIKDIIITSLMFVLVVLLGFDRRGARRGARGVGAKRALVRVAAKLAGASVLDESEGQVFVVVEVIQDLVVRVTERVNSPPRRARPPRAPRAAGDPSSRSDMSLRSRPKPGRSTPATLRVMARAR